MAGDSSPGAARKRQWSKARGSQSARSFQRTTPCDLLLIPSRLELQPLRKICPVLSCPVQFVHPILTESSCWPSISHCRNFNSFSPFVYLCLTRALSERIPTAGFRRNHAQLTRPPTHTDPGLGDPSAWPRYQHCPPAPAPAPAGSAGTSAMRRDLPILDRCVWGVA